MILLASHIEGVYGGVPMLNQLILGAAERGNVDGAIAAFVDTPDANWQQRWQESSCASGRRMRFMLAALRFARRRRGETILVTHLGVAPVGRLAKGVGGGRMVVMLLGAEAVAPLPAITRWALRSCDLLVSISQCTLTRFLERNPEFRSIPSEVCLLPARRLPEPLARPREDVRPLRVITVGRLFGRGLEKGQPQLIRVWPEIQRRFPGAELVIVGTGEGRAALQKIAQECGVSGSVTFTGGVPDEELTRLYRSADVFAMPSKHEGFGLVFAEAMSEGLPCVASRVDAGAEVVIDGETGCVVDPESLPEIRDALLKLLGDSAGRARMGEAARRRAAEVFSPEGFDARMQTLLTGGGSVSARRSA